MRYVRWLGLIACSVAGLGYLSEGSYDMAGLLLALAVLSGVNIQRKCEQDP